MESARFLTTPGFIEIVHGLKLVFNFLPSRIVIQVEFLLSTFTIHKQNEKKRNNTHQIIIIIIVDFLFSVNPFCPACTQQREPNRIEKNGI